MPKLSARFVETVSKPGRYGDGDGLCLLVSQSGAKKWVLRYQVAGRRRDMGLGTFPEVLVAAAREKALAARRTIAEGKDPIAERRAKVRATTIPTFREIAREVIDIEQAKSTNDKVRYQWELLLGPAYCGSILDQPVNSVTITDVERILRPVWHKKPETARKLLRRLRRVFDHARIRLRDAHGVVMPANPAAWADLKALGFEAPQKLSTGPHPSLDYRELPAFVAALRQRPGLAARALELLVLTATRSGSVRQARWDEFDFEKAIWIIPIAHMKDKRTRRYPFRVPLPEEVMALLRALHTSRTSDLVFPGPSGEKPISEMAMTMLLRKMNVVENGNARWRDPQDDRPIVPHGFRATFRTWSEEKTHAPRAVMEEALGHQVGTEVERAYRRTDVLELRRQLMADWASFCGNGDYTLRKSQ